MVDYSIKPNKLISFKKIKVDSFIIDNELNSDSQTVESFGDEWEKFNIFSDDEINNAGKQYFDIVKQDILTKDTIVLDAGCGSGRWSRFIAHKVKFVEAIDPSKSIFYAKNNNFDIKNIRFSHAGIENIPFKNESFDFIFSLGVLHHIPKTEEALLMLFKKLKKGGSILLYLYYSFDNRSSFYNFLFKPINFLRYLISKLPKMMKFLVCDLIAAFVYVPLKFISKLFKFFLRNNFYKKIPLYYYHDKSFNIIRNDSLDRFGTPLEQRFSKLEIKEMLIKVGAKEIVFSDSEPYWHVICKK